MITMMGISKKVVDNVEFVGGFGSTDGCGGAVCVCVGGG